MDSWTIANFPFTDANLFKDAFEKAQQENEKIFGASEE